ncbi:MAG TPA: secondary thiamine-phosphate synthase enzyme YjbQ [Candidatus Xenobia bacterium]
MAVKTIVWDVPSQAQGNMTDLTPRLENEVTASGLQDGIATVFVTGSTAGVSTIEWERGLLSDFKVMQERWIPENLQYAHNEGERDDNGHSHLRATMLGPSLTVPFTAGQLHLGTWQQVVLVDFDTKPRSRRIICQVMGE